MRRTFVLLALLPLVALGCGSIEHEPNLAKAVERTEATGSSRIEVRAPLVEEGRKLDFRCEGTADYGRRRLRLACNYGFEMIGIGDSQYLTGESLGVRTDKRWVKVPLDENDVLLSNFSPERILGLLRDASLETVRLGEESVRQVPTVRYRLTVNCEEAGISCPGTTGPVNVWIDDDGLVRRIELEDDGTPVTIEFFDFGIEVDIEAPPAEEVQDAADVFKPEPCAGGQARPISVERAISTLRNHAFAVSKDDFGCSGRVAASLSNVSSGDDEWLSCFVTTRPAGGDATLVLGAAIPGRTDRPPIERELENVRCSLFARGPGAGEASKRLDAAFDELERAIRP